MGTPWPTQIYHWCRYNLYTASPQRFEVKIGMKMSWVMLIPILMSPYITDSFKAFGCENCSRENLKDVGGRAHGISLIPAGCWRMPVMDAFSAGMLLKGDVFPFAKETGFCMAVPFKIQDFNCYLLATFVSANQLHISKTKRANMDGVPCCFLPKPWMSLIRKSLEYQKVVKKTRTYGN